MARRCLTLIAISGSNGALILNNLLRISILSSTGSRSSRILLRDTQMIILTAPYLLGTWPLMLHPSCYNISSRLVTHLSRAQKVIYDNETGQSKGYGFVAFGDANEHRQAMAEMNGAYCSTRPMRIGPAPNKRIHPIGTQGTDFRHQDPSTSRLFVGSLGQSVTSEDLRQAFTPYGEPVYAKVLEGKHCGFVTYSSRASAEKAILMLNESQLGGSSIQVSFARPLSKKQDQLNVGHHGRPQSYGPGSGWFPQDPYACAQTGHPGYGSFQQQQPQVQ